LTYNENNYIEDAHRTAPEESHFVVFDEERHAVYGIVGEIGELVALYQDGELTKANVKDELGDVCWYMALMLHHHGHRIWDSYISPPDMLSLRKVPGHWRDKSWILMKMVRHAASMAELLKKRDAYGKQFEWERIRLHVAWIHISIVQLASVFEIPAIDILAANIAKLSARYPDKFDPELAINKDEEAERVAIEATTA
jgi:hypothetical protein